MKTAKPTKNLGRLFLIFLKVGFFTIGGGLAMVALFQSEFCEKRDWLTIDEMADVVAMTQTIPGVIAVNTAAFVGYRLFRVPGAIIAALGALIPSVVIISIIGIIYASVFQNEFVIRAFRGVSCALAAMVIASGVKMLRNTIKTPFMAIVAICAGVCVFLFPSSIIYVIITAAVIGFIYTKVTGRYKLSGELRGGEGDR